MASLGLRGGMREIWKMTVRVGRAGEPDGCFVIGSSYIRKSQILQTETPDSSAPGASIWRHVLHPCDKPHLALASTYELIDLAFRRPAAMILIVSGEGVVGESRGEAVGTPP